VKKKLGKHRASVACLYIKSPGDIDRAVLRQMAVAAVAATRKRYPG